MRALLLIPLLWATLAHADLSRPLTAIPCPCVHKGAAPDWSSWEPAGQGFLMILNWEQDDPFNSTPPFFDSSAEHQHLTPGAGPTVSHTASQVRQQCGAMVNGSVTAPIWTADCTVPLCTIGDRCPINQPFTEGCWINPDDVESSERYEMTSDAFDGSPGSGTSFGWRQTAAGSGNFMFSIDPTGGANETQITSAGTFTPGSFYHHVARYFYRPGQSTGTLQQFINGVQDANTATVAPVSTCDKFSIGGGAFYISLTGIYDECFFANVALDDPSICRIAVCGIDGCGCSCDWTGDPTTYTDAPRHASFGGSIGCTLPACNITTPSTILPTTTSTTVVTTSTTTSTSTSSTSSTSSSSTTSTSSSTTSTSTTTTTSSTEPGATTTTSTTIVTTSTTSTTSTSSTTTTSSTTSTSIATTSTTSTSTTTTSSTTTSTILAHDMSNEMTLVLYLQMSESAPNSGLTDQSPAGNNFPGGSCSTAARNSTEYWDTDFGANPYSVKNNGTGSESCDFACSGSCVDSDFDFVADFTCGAWVLPTTEITGTTENILGTTLSNSPGGWRLYRSLMSNTWLFYIADGSDGITAESTTADTDDQERLLVARYDATADSMKLYVDGVNEGSATQQSPTATSDFHVWGSDAGAFSYGLQGSLDHVFCFNRALADTSLCWIETCGVNGEFCTCNGSVYATAPKHTSHGGPITCTLPACNITSLSYLN